MKIPAAGTVAGALNFYSLHEYSFTIQKTKRKAIPISGWLFIFIWRFSGASPETHPNIRSLWLEFYNGL
jgi:hypothetical protein